MKSTSRACGQHEGLSSDVSMVSQRWAPSPKMGANLLFGQFFSQKCMKMKKFWLWGACVLLASANAYFSETSSSLNNVILSTLRYFLFTCIKWSITTSIYQSIKLISSLHKHLNSTFCLHTQGSRISFRPTRRCLSRRTRRWSLRRTRARWSAPGPGSTTRGESKSLIYKPSRSRWTSDPTVSKPGWLESQWSFP